MTTLCNTKADGALKRSRGFSYRAVAPWMVAIMAPLKGEQEEMT
jgi:hypothetical protein